ncbi:putative holin-like toxin [Paenibacillus taichungensis]
MLMLTFGTLIVAILSDRRK